TLSRYRYREPRGCAPRAGLLNSEPDLTARTVRSRNSILEQESLPCGVAPLSGPYNLHRRARGSVALLVRPAPRGRCRYPYRSPPPPLPPLADPQLQALLASFRRTPAGIVPTILHRSHTRRTIDETLRAPPASHMLYGYAGVCAGRRTDHGSGHR